MKEKLNQKISQRQAIKACLLWMFLGVTFFGMIFDAPYGFAQDRRRRDDNQNAEARPVVLRDAETEELFAMMSKPILTSAGLVPENVRIVLLGNPEINAFVSGGQQIFINSGLILKADNAAEVIGVMAHETGHITGGHLSRTREAVVGATLSSAAATLAGVAAAIGTGNAEAGVAIASVGQEVGRRSFFTYSRAQESSADQAGFTFLQQANLPADGFLSFMEKLAGEEFLPDARKSAYVRTHPVTADRVETIKSLIENQKTDEATNPAASVPKIPPEVDQRFRWMRAKLMGYLTPQVALRTFRSDDVTTEAKYGRAVAYYRLGDVEQALSVLQSLQTEFPEYPFFYEMAGQILFEYGRFDESIAEYTRAQTLRPSEPLIALALAQVYVERGGEGDYDKALVVIKPALEASPQMPLSHRLLATIYGQRGEEGLARYHQAEEALATGDKDRALKLAEAAVPLLEAHKLERRQAQDIVFLYGEAEPSEDNTAETKGEAK